jgi:hypothetical protein
MKPLDKATVLGMLDKVSDDEPVFLLRAQDEYSFQALVAWLAGFPTIDIGRNTKILNPWRSWQNQNKTKAPD